MSDEKTANFKVHTPELMKRIEELNAKGTGTMRIPLHEFKSKLFLVALRASQLDDPILNKLMCDLTLYEVADPYSLEYDKKVLEKVDKEYKAKLAFLEGGKDE